VGVFPKSPLFSSDILREIEQIEAEVKISHHCTQFINHHTIKMYEVKRCGQLNAPANLSLGKSP
jgi:hypothetical protein